MWTITGWLLMLLVERHQIWQALCWFEHMVYGLKHNVSCFYEFKMLLYSVVVIESVK